MMENPTTTVRTDTEIEQLVRQELIWDDRVNSTDITVNVLNGVVTLTGTVPSYSQLSLASADAWKIDGVRDVDNLLTVRLPETVTAPSDAQIETNVEAMLRWNATVDSAQIDVTVANGTVTLEGTVEDYWQKWRAEDLVADLSGVILVENHLTVVPTESFVDQDIAEDIEAALERNLYVVAEDITVEVETGVVTLTGTVPTYHAHAEAYNAAMNTVGVVEVHNNITVA
jgi:osmotically-inducible protein OsmY